MMMYAVHVAEAGAAILTYTRTADAIDVEAMDRLPAGLDAVADWLRERLPTLPDIGDSSVVIDADGLGRALWDLLRVRGKPGWKLYDKTGRDRQELVNALLVAMSGRRIHIADGTHEVALRKALGAYRRVVLDDGIIGTELVVGLALAALVRPKVPLYVGAA